MTATEAAARLNAASLAMKSADARNNEENSAASDAALDVTIAAHRDALDAWASAYALEISGDRLAEIRAAA